MTANVQFLRKATIKIMAEMIFGETLDDFFIARRFGGSKEKHNYFQVMRAISFEIV